MNTTTGSKKKPITKRRQTILDAIFNSCEISKQQNTPTTYTEAADEILSIMDDFGFYTDVRFDPSELKDKIVKAIQDKIEGTPLHPQRRELNLEEADKRGKELWESD